MPSRANVGSCKCRRREGLRVDVGVYEGPRGGPGGKKAVPLRWGPSLFLSLRHTDATLALSSVSVATVGEDANKTSRQSPRCPEMGLY